MRPHGPLSEQAAVHPTHAFLATLLHGERRREIPDDIVVVPGVQRDVVAAGLTDRAHDVESLVAIEGRDFDRPQIRNLRELAPKRIIEYAPANGGLEIKTEERDDIRYGATVREQLVGCRAGE